MFQRINLYKEKKQNKIILPLRQIIVINILIISVLLLDTIYVFYGYYKTQLELQKLKDSQERLNKGLVSVQKTIPTEEQKELLQKKLTELQQINTYKKKMFATLSELHYQDSVKLSGYLNAMAEQSLADLWLTKFHLEENGAKLSFEGVALNSSSIPKYLEELGKAKIFSNRTFEKIQISLDEQTKQIKFTIGTLET